MQPTSWRFEPKVSMRRFFISLAMTASAANTAFAAAPKQACAAPATLAETAVSITENAAPGMHVKPLGDAGTKVFFITFKTGDDVLSGIKRFARENGIRSGTVSAVGALGCTVTGWYDVRIHRLKTRVLPGDREVVSLAGNLSMLGDAPLAHLHVALADAHGNVQGGHLVRAFVGPGLEVTVTATPQTLERVEDPVGASYVPVMP